MVCRYPYPRDVDELHDYNHVTTHFLAEQKLRKHKPQITDSSSSTPEGERRIYSVSYGYSLVHGCLFLTLQLACMGYGLSMSMGNHHGWMPFPLPCSLHAWWYHGVRVVHEKPSWMDPFSLPCSLHAWGMGCP